MLPDIDALFFDFDGVILDSVPLKASVFERMAEQIAPGHVERIMHHYWTHGGVSRLEKFRWIGTEVLLRPFTDDEIAQLGRQFREEVAVMAPHCDLIPGALAFLEEHAVRWPCFLISGTPEPELRELVAARGLSGYFRGVFGSPRAKSDIGATLLSEHRFDPRRVWFIGDATTDRDAARALGAHFVGLDGPHLTPFRRGDEIVIRDLHELLDAIRGQLAT